MILLSESDLTYPLFDMSYYVLLSVLVWFFTRMVPRYIYALVLV